MILHITYTDGSNPYYHLKMKEQSAWEEIRFNLNHNKVDTILLIDTDIKKTIEIKVRDNQ